jgi:ferrous iron transport protein B
MSHGPQHGAVTNVAFIGNPNTGKSTIFSGLAGVHTRIGNFPGVTVEKKTARVGWDDAELVLIDLPGTYSLSPRSADEKVSVDVLLGKEEGVGDVDVVVCIVDSSNLERNLYLATQVLDVGLPTVLVLNMWDVAESRGTTVDVDLLSKRLKCPVIKTMAHRNAGLDELKTEIVRAIGRKPAIIEQPFPEAFCRERDSLKQFICEQDDSETSDFLITRLLIDRGGAIEADLSKRYGEQLVSFLNEARQRLADDGNRVPMLEAKVRYGWIREQLHGVIVTPAAQPITASDRLDRILTHRFWGILFFCLLMLVVFQSIYSWSGPIMDGIGDAQKWVAGLIEGMVGPGPLRSLLVDGAVAGVGGVLIFLPQIVLLFLFIAILEDSGYMARAAFLMDKLMTKVGLSGKSFVPLMSSFACAIPGIMATRVIENPKDRLVTILVAPLMSCSARLPVYIVLIGAFIPPTAYLGGLVTLQGLTLFAMTSLGALIAIPVAWILKKTYFKGETPPFIMELPSYKIPSPRIVFSRVYDSARAFIVRAGTLIFATTVVVWAAGYFPGDHTELISVQREKEPLKKMLKTLEEDSPKYAELTERVDKLTEQENKLNAELLAGSFLGRAGRAIEPVVKPLGWDWRIGIGAIASFPAREVIISTLGTVYSLGGDVDEESQDLQNSLKSVKWPDGRPVFNIAVALSLMVFFALCAQCGATLVVMRRETNSWRWPIFTFVYMTTLAYVGALITYQVAFLFI